MSLSLSLSLKIVIARSSVPDAIIRIRSILPFLIARIGGNNIVDRDARTMKLELESPQFGPLAALWQGRVMRVPDSGLDNLPNACIFRVEARDSSAQVLACCVGNVPP